MPPRATPEAKQSAKSLRRAMTVPERILWCALRDRNLHGLKFRRQHPLSPYVADFFCHDARLIVEVDGGVHLRPEQIEHDRRRGEWLSSQGYRTLRVGAGWVTRDRWAVMKRIVEVAREQGVELPTPPLPPPLPRAGEDRSSASETT